MSANLALMHIRCDQLSVPSRNGSTTMPALSGSASIKDKTLTLTMTNPSLQSSVAASIQVTSGSVVEGRGRVLTHADMTARNNTFDNPDEVKPAPLSVTVYANRTTVSIPTRAVVSLELILS